MIDYILSFNEHTQQFYIIPVGVTANATHGQTVASVEAENLPFLQGFVRGFAAHYSHTRVSIEAVKTWLRSGEFDAVILKD